MTTQDCIIDGIRRSYVNQNGQSTRTLIYMRVSVNRNLLLENFVAAIVIIAGMIY